MAVKSRITRFPCFWSLQLYFRRWVAMNISRFFKRTIPIKSWRDICAKINDRLRSREEKWLTCNEKKEISLWKDQSLVNLRTHHKILASPRLLALNRITARAQNSPACYVHKLTFETETEYKMWHVCCVHSRPCTAEQRSFIRESLTKNEDSTRQKKYLSFGEVFVLFYDVELMNVCIPISHLMI